ncbi:MAG: hypothetical protein JWQ07_1968 [Ramlibacter sp.]|nr:hypothetical protein [Ramlibacter sp.]
MTRAFIAALLFVALAPPAVCAQDADPLNSAACKAAREALESVFDDPGLSRQARAGRLGLARENAAAACLGRSAGQRERSGAPVPAQAVPAPAITAGRLSPAPLPAPAPPAPPLAISRPAAITTCDPAGCWDSEGRRLNNMGPLLIGPRGPCTLQGGLVNCP